MSTQPLEPGAAFPDSQKSSSDPHFSSDRSFIKRIQHLLHRTPSIVPLLVLLMAVIGFSILLGHRFLSPFTLTLVLQQVSVIGVVTVAQTLIILTAGIDLSVGAIMVLSTVVMGHAVMHYGFPGPLAVGLGLFVGLVCGVINGWLVANIKLPPFIVTLGTWQIYLATNYLYSNNESIQFQTLQAKAPALLFLGNTFNVLGASLTYGVILMFLLVALFAYALFKTSWGRYVYAVGDDSESARLAGVRTKRILYSVYILSGLICALAGWVMIGRVGAVTPQAGELTNISSITAVVIGGVSLFGGRGSIYGAFFGGLIVGVFTLGLRMAGFDPQWTYLLIGALIIVAVMVDQWIRKVSA
ncbi:MAG: ABC transporter permease [Acidihalobacter sp.]|uniref:ABC transporter permease n=1 Tax=Acidihalobacter sp. TaxID=1872108 RepID=UPI00307EB587